MSPGNRAKLLLVDDQVENLIALEAVLEPLGLELVRAHVGKSRRSAACSATSSR